MQKLNWVMAFAMALGVSGAALAADLQNANGQSCGGLPGVWHFVNNQTGGASQGTLNAFWSDPAESCTVVAYKVKKKVQHFLCVASGTLEDAYTDLPGRLVLSDFTCDAKCTDPKGCEPPCTDPKGCEPPCTDPKGCEEPK